MKTYLLVGTLTSITPLTVSIKGAVGKGGHHLPRNGGVNSEAYFPSTSIRGALRHALHRVVINRERKINDGVLSFDLADHFMLAQGVDIVGNIIASDAGDLNVPKLVKEKNPLLSLCGRWGLAGKLGVSNAIPQGTGNTAIFGSGARTIMFERSPELLEYLDAKERSRLESIMQEQHMASVDINEIKKKKSLLAKELSHASAEEKTAIFHKLNELDAEIAERKELKGEAKESIRRPLDGYEAFVAGTTFDHHFSLKRVNSVELGFFIAGLVEFARGSLLGGHHAHGCGKVSGSWDVKVWEDDALTPSVVGKLSFSDEGFVIEGDAMNKALEQWQNAKGLDFTVYS